MTTDELNERSIDDLLEQIRQKLAQNPDLKLVRTVHFVCLRHHVLLETQDCPACTREAA